MTLETQMPMQDRIAGWISEALSSGEAKVELQVRKMAEAEGAGIWARVRALEGALRSAKLGHRGATEAVTTLCNRIQLIASVYDMREVQTAAAAIGRAASLPGAAPSAGADVAMAMLVDMATKASLDRRPQVATV
jgi:hypothetical protein